MFNIKWGGIAAGAAFVLSLLLSLLLGQTNLPIALLRAVIFAALFFGLGIAAWALINSFIPELLSTSGGGGDIATHLFSTENAGSRVNITVGDPQNAALPEQERGAADGGEVGDFNELFTPKDIDQIPATGYTGEGEADGLASGNEFAATAGEFGVETEEFASAFNEAEFNEEDEAGGLSMDFSAFVPGGLDGGGGGGSDGEPDEADSDMDSFSFFPDGGAPATTFDEPDSEERKVSRNKPMKLEGDFNAKEIAAGLRTVLEKDKK
jgi:hypothetical protein